MITKFIVAATIALFLNSCNIKADFGNGTEGNGKTTTEVRNVSKNFRSINVGCDIEVILEQSDRVFVSVEAESNLQKLIVTKVERGVLIIEPNESISPNKTIKVVVRMPNIEGLEASSSSKIKSIGYLKGDSISIDASIVILSYSSFTSTSPELDASIEIESPFR